MSHMGFITIRKKCGSLWKVNHKNNDCCFPSVRKFYESKIKRLCLHSCSIYGTSSQKPSFRIRIDHEKLKIAWVKWLPILHSFGSEIYICHWNYLYILNLVQKFTTSVFMSIFYGIALTKPVVLRWSDFYSFPHSTNA